MIYGGVRANCAHLDYFTGYMSSVRLTIRTSKFPCKRTQFVFPNFILNPETSHDFRPISLTTILYPWMCISRKICV